jgi:hypothetical protein
MAKIKLIKKDLDNGKNEEKISAADINLNKIGSSDFRARNSMPDLRHLPV